MSKLKTASALIMEAMDPNYKKWRKANVTYRGTRPENEWPLDGINEYEGKFGTGLYTTPLSNKAMTKDYGKRWLIVGGIPDKPLKFRDVNSAEIWIQQLMMKVVGGDFPDHEKFNKKTSLNKEVEKLGYDGIEISGREMVLFNPVKEKLRAFATENQLERWYDDFFAPSTGKIKWVKDGSLYVARKAEEEVEAGVEESVDTDEYDVKQTILGKMYVRKGLFKKRKKK